MYSMSGAKHQEVRVSQSSIVTARSNDPRSRIGVSPITAEIQDKYAHLKEAFALIDTDGDHQLSFEEVYAFFNKKSMAETGVPFDKDFCQKLYSKLDRNQDQAVTIDEIILAYCDQENMIYKQMEEKRKEIDSANAQIKNLQKKKFTAEQQDKTNEKGIMHDSILTVNVIEAQNLIPMDWGVSSDPYVIIYMKDNKQRITTKIVSNELNPVWNEVFSFDISTGEEPLIVTVMNDHGDDDDFEGQVVIPMEKLKDQLIHDRFYNLKHHTEPDKKWQGRIHLSLQWIWDRVKYYNGLEDEWQATIDLKQGEIDKLEEQLVMLRKPFGMLKYHSELVGQSLPGLEPVQEVPDQMLALAKMMGKMDYVSQDMDYAISQALLAGNPVPWNVFAFVMSYVLVIVSTLVMFFRSDFVSVTFAIWSVYFFTTKKYSELIFRLLTIGCIASLIMDALWLWMFTVDWEKGIKSPEDAVRRLVILFSLVNVFCKIPMVIIFWRTALEEKRAKAGIT